MIEPENIPDEIIDREQWICWEVGKRNGKETKLPRAPWEAGHTANVSATDPENWTDFWTAHDWASKMTGWGIGFVFSADGPYVGIDLDDCLKDDGRIMPSAGDILSRFQTYAEVSPSGTGLHIICKGHLDSALKNDDRGVELYDRDRFFTFTGDLLGDKQRPVTEEQVALEHLMDEYMVDEDEPPEEEPDLPDDPDIPDTGDHPLYELSVRDVYPTLPHGQNIEHPVHGSTTGANFKIHERSPTAVCWRGEHNQAGRVCCVLCAWHLLAMEALNEKNCRRVARQYQHNDKLVFAAWKEAYKQNLVSGHHPPWRAVNHIAQRKGLEEHLDEGGKGAWAVYRACCRLIRSEHDIPVRIDDE